MLAALYWPQPAAASDPLRLVTRKALITKQAAGRGRFRPRTGGGSQDGTGLRFGRLAASPLRTLLAPKPIYRRDGNTQAGKFYLRRITEKRVDRKRGPNTWFRPWRVVVLSPMFYAWSSNYFFGGGGGDGVGFLMFRGFWEAPFSPLPRRLGAKLAILPSSFLLTHQRQPLVFTDRVDDLQDPLL